MVIAAPPEIPGKYDIIPIHTSDVASFLRCRRYWSWSSPARNNLRTRADVSGINPNLWFGTGIHYALEKFYHPVLRRDPVEAWQTWFKYQWDGGVVTEELLEHTYDNNPHPVGAAPGEHLYQVRGLRDILPQYDEEEYMQYRDLGTNMMEFYKQYVPNHDDFQVVATESTYSVPLGFTSVDIREESPNYGKQLEVHARGKRDAICYRERTDSFFVTDHKTAAVIGPEYFDKIDTDPQVSNYIWASREEAIGNDLPWKRINECLYQALRKAAPMPPTMLQSGLPSVSRTTESTTAVLFQDFIVRNNLQVWFDDNDKAQSYYNYLVECGDENFIQRRTTYRSKTFLDNVGKNLRMIAEEMLDNDIKIYPRFTGEIACVRCAFRAPCIAVEDGADAEFILDNNYEPNRGR